MAQKRQQRKRGQRDEIRDEFDQVILDLARVTRVMAGGKRMRFRASVAIGDKKGRIGIGVAKGADVSLAISKATNDAKKHLHTVMMTESGTIPHPVRIRTHSAQLLLKPAPAGTGIIAGSVVRQIFELAGVKDVVGKIMGTDNKVNNARAVIEAVSMLRKPQKKQVKKNTPKPKKGSDEKTESKKDEDTL
jgi:small subunit ribosomal protein S5